MQSGRATFSILLVTGAFAAALPAQRRIVELPSFGGPTERGAALAEIRDVSGDRRPDWVLGEPAAEGSPPLHQRGSIVILTGRADDIRIHRTVFGIAENARFGAAVDVIDDIDGDGAQEIVVGAPARAGFDPSAFVVSGRTGAILRQHFGARGSELGFAVRNVGDFDRDGVSDYALGAPAFSPGTGAIGGLVEVRSGRTGEELLLLVGGSRTARFGHAIEALGDVDRDGVPDLAIGAPGTGATDAGFVDIRLGIRGTLTTRLGSVGLGSSFGAALAKVGDLDGDGRDDLLIGEPGTGRAVIFSCGRRLVFRTHIQGGDRFGAAVARIADVDLDGVPDYAIGAPFASNGPRPSGRVHFWSGAIGMPIGSLAAAQRTFFGGAILSVTDVEGDGVEEFLIGAASSNGSVTVATWDQDGPIRYEDGRGCAGSVGRPVLRILGRRAIGTSLRVEVDPVPVGSPALVYFGFSTQRWGAIALPFDLVAIGAAGCQVGVSVDVTVDLSVPTVGPARADVPIPPTPSLIGRPLHAQSFVFDPAANAAGLALSGSASLQIGF